MCVFMTGISAALALHSRRELFVLLTTAEDSTGAVITIAIFGQNRSMHNGRKEDGCGDVKKGKRENETNRMRTPDTLIDIYTK